MKGTDCGMMTPEVMEGMAIFCKAPRDLGEIISETAIDLCVVLKDLLSEKRDQRTSNARAIAMYRCRKLTGKSFPEIARAFGRTHSTIMHACDLVERRLGKGALTVGLKPMEHQVLAS